MYDASELKELFENCFLSYIPEADSYTSLLEESENYSLSTGGKRLRPMILLAVCQMLGGNIEEAVPFAAALEFIHTYSLIHDDLPAMDNDDYRRGKASSHKAFGEDIAILTGDALLTRAFGIMAHEINRDDDHHKILALRTISDAAYSMVRGQISDVKAPSDIDEDYLEYVHLNKTGALFRAAFLTGAYLAKASEETIEDMNTAGVLFGKAFQIYDDYHDFESDKGLNFAILYGKDKAEEKYIEYISRFRNIITKYRYNEALSKICAFGDIDG